MDLHMRDCMFVILLLSGYIVTVTALTGLDKETGLHLDCTNDFDEKMFCDFEAQNCSVYNVTLQSNDGHGTQYCLPMHCNSGRCCCSFEIVAIMGETLTAVIWKGDQGMESKIIRIEESIKPKVPTIDSVEEANGKFLVKWKTNMAGWFAATLTARVMYYEKGDTKEVIQDVNPVTINGLSIYEIDGQDLEPSTTYVVSVRSFADISGKFSDSSPEYEFTTPVSSNFLPLAIIISLSFAAVLISSAIFGCYVKLKGKWWDTVAKCPNPNLLVMHPYEQMFLKPESLITSSVSVEPLLPDDCNSWSLTDTSSEKYQQSSGISTCSSFLSYANTEPADIVASVNEALSKVFPNIGPMTFLSTNLHKESNKDSGSFSSGRADNINSGSSNFDNKTYSILIPSCPQQNMIDSSKVQTQAKMFCDSAYHPSEADITVTSPDRWVEAFQLPNLLPMVPSLLETDMSYQQCNADSGQLSNAEDSSLSSISSGAHTTASCELEVEAGYKSFDEAVSCVKKPSGKSEVLTICGESCGPTGSQSFPPVDDANQAFQNVVGQPRPEKEEHLSKYPVESFTKIFPAFIHNVQGEQCFSERQRNMFPRIFAEKPMSVITSSGYQSV